MTDPLVEEDDFIQTPKNDPVPEEDHAPIVIPEGEETPNEPDV